MIESEMLNIGVRYLMKQRKYKEVKQEVPFLSRCIDVVAINEDNEVISIEFKIIKWRHAIEQASNHKLGSDKAFICLPKRKISDTLRQALIDNGIGLMMFDENSDDVITEAVPAAREPSNVPLFRKMLIKNLEKI